MNLRCATLAPVLALVYQVAGAGPAPQELVRQTSDRLLQAVRAEREIIDRDPGRLHNLVEQIVLPVIDAGCITRAVLGKHWRAATPEQHARFTEEFQTLLIRTYAAPLVNHTDVDITYLPLKVSEAKDHVTVRTLIRYGKEEPVPVHYWLRHRNGEWKACDVTIAGVSAAITLRSAFSHEIQKTGLEGFLDRLAQHNRKQQLRPGDDVEIPLPEFGSKQ